MAAIEVSLFSLTFSLKFSFIHWLQEIPVVILNRWKQITVRSWQPCWFYFNKLMSSHIVTTAKQQSDNELKLKENQRLDCKSWSNRQKFNSFWCVVVFLFNKFLYSALFCNMIIMHHYFVWILNIYVRERKVKNFSKTCTSILSRH